MDFYYLSKNPAIGTRVYAYRQRNQVRSCSLRTYNIVKKTEKKQTKIKSDGHTCCADKYGMIC